MYPGIAHYPVSTCTVSLACVADATPATYQLLPLSQNLDLSRFGQRMDLLHCAKNFINMITRKQMIFLQFDKQIMSLRLHCPIFKCFRNELLF